MENFLEQFGVINLLALVWLAFLFAVWRAVRLEARDRCAMYARNYTARIQARRDKLRAWHWNNTPINIRD